MEFIKKQKLVARRSKIQNLISRCIIWVNLDINPKYKDGCTVLKAHINPKYKDGCTVLKAHVSSP
jgi:hypothetical protein